MNKIKLTEVRTKVKVARQIIQGALHTYEVDGDKIKLDASLVGAINRLEEIINPEEKVEQ